MIPELLLRGRPVHSVFELLGDKENDITSSIGWAFARCPVFLGRFVTQVTGVAPTAPIRAVLLQQYGDGGITDIEIYGTTFRVLIEAKRGFEVPGLPQLSKYAARLSTCDEPSRFIVTLSEASTAFARQRLPASVLGIPCIHRELKTLKALATGVRGSHAEKRLLSELRTYLTRVSTVQDINSNVVYVVALSDTQIPDSSITWRQMVEDHHCYITLIGNGYPKIPVNYLGFRYEGKLQSIRHVTRCEAIDSLDARIAGCGYKLDVPHYLYHLGPPIVPSKTVRTGQIHRAGRVYAAIDLLLTCDTISEAGKKHRLRHSDS